MSEQDPLLVIRFEGEAVGPGRVPVADLVCFLDNFQKALQRLGRVLLGHSERPKKGRLPQVIKNEVDLKLVSLQEGSPAAVLGFERTKTQSRSLGLDLGQEILEKALNGLRSLQTIESNEPLSEEFELGVLRTWHNAGRIFKWGIERAILYLNGPEKSFRTAFTPTTIDNIMKHIGEKNKQNRTIVGRLLMADFKEYGTRCRVHPPVGDPIVCIFDESQRDQVLKCILRKVHIQGEAEQGTVSGGIERVVIRTIKCLDDEGIDENDNLSESSQSGYSFFESPSLKELAESQKVRPLNDVRVLFGTWPGDAEDGFESLIDELRHSHDVSKDLP